MEGPLNMLRRNDMHLPKPSAKLMNRRNPVRMSGGTGRGEEDVGGRKSKREENERGRRMRDEK